MGAFWDPYHGTFLQLRKSGSGIHERLAVSAGIRACFGNFQGRWGFPGFGFRAWISLHCHF